MVCHNLSSRNIRFSLNNVAYHFALMTASKNRLLRILWRRPWFVYLFVTKRNSIHFRLLFHVSNFLTRVFIAQQWGKISTKSSITLVGFSLLLYFHMLFLCTVKPIIYDALNSNTLIFLVSPFNCLCPIHWSQVLSREWRCSWSSTDRRCANYIWVIDNFNAYEDAPYIRVFTVICVLVIIHKK